MNTDDAATTGPRPRGWLLVLCALLIGWQPLSLAFVAANALESLALRGWPLAAGLALRMVVVGLGMAAGLALLTRKIGAVSLAIWAVALSAAMDLFVYLTPIFPNNRMPGQTPWFIAASLVFHGAWLAYLIRLNRGGADDEFR